MKWSQAGEHVFPFTTPSEHWLSSGRSVNPAKLTFAMATPFTLALTPSTASRQTALSKPDVTSCPGRRSSGFLLFSIPSLRQPQLIPPRRCLHENDQTEEGTRSSLPTRAGQRFSGQVGSVQCPHPS